MKAIHQIVDYLQAEGVLSNAEYTQVLTLIEGERTTRQHDEDWEDDGWRDDPYNDEASWHYLDVERALGAGVRRSRGGAGRRKRRRARKRGFPKKDVTLTTLTQRIRDRRPMWAPQLVATQTIADYLREHSTTPVDLRWRPCRVIAERGDVGDVVEKMLGVAALCPKALVAFLGFDGHRRLLRPAEERGSVVQRWANFCRGATEVFDTTSELAWLSEVICAQRHLMRALTRA